MLFIKNVFILLSSMTSLVVLDTIVKNANNYGPYDIILDHFDLCKGPKSKNLTHLTNNLNVNKSNTIVNMTVFNDMKIEEIKVQVYNVKDNKKNFLWNYKLNDPCRHYAIAAFIKEHTGAINCVVKKGEYIIEIKFKEVVIAFLGKSFFYGTYWYKADVLSKTGNYACFDSMILIKKKLET